MEIEKSKSENYCEIISHERVQTQLRKKMNRAVFKIEESSILTYVIAFASSDLARFRLNVALSSKSCSR